MAGQAARLRISPAVRGGARGVVAAMAMTGMRKVTTGFKLLPEHPPPEEIVRRTTSPVLPRIPQGRGKALVELLHWSYGALGGSLFGLLPRRWRRLPWIGPAYGFLFWLLFDAVIAPRLNEPRWQSLRTRSALLADHTLYGMVVAASSWPHAD